MSKDHLNKHVQSERISNSPGLSNVSAQFVNATAANYQPTVQSIVKQTTPPVANPSDTSPQNTTPISNSSDTLRQNKTPVAKPNDAPPQNKPAAAAATTASGGKSIFYQEALKSAEGFQPLPSQPIDLSSFKGYRFVMIDNLITDEREIYNEISGTYEWEMCAGHVNNCINYVKGNGVDRRVFLIVTGSLGKEVVPAVHDLPQVYAIYVYCGDVDGHKKWALSHSKVRVVCNDDEKVLLPQFAVDVAKSNIEWGDALSKQGNHAAARAKFDHALKNLMKYKDWVDQTLLHLAERKVKECK